MNPTISHLSSKDTLNTIYQHCSIRRFEDRMIDKDIRLAILEAGRAASSSSFMQSVHIIRVTDSWIRQELCAIASNQQYVKEAPEFWVFCIDYAKHKMVFPEAQVSWTESVITSSVDAGIMAQNCLLAAESLGLGGVYIGSIRNDIARASELLNLPKYMAVLFGLCLGYPAQNPMYRPRLPLTTLVSENYYQSPQWQVLADYDMLLKRYYQKRSHIDLDWTQAVINNFNKPVRPAVLPFLQSQGLAMY